MKTVNRVTIVLLMTMLALGGAAATAQEEDEGGSFQLPVLSSAAILDAEGNQLGMAAIGDDGEGGVGMVILVQGLEPGEHGLHLHEQGNCDPAGEKTFEQAGGHVNPGGTTHPNHAGDYGNLVIDDAGAALWMGTLDMLTWDNGEMGLADADGTALVIHADPDDMVTDPSGNSGARIACAVLAPPAA